MILENNAGATKSNDLWKEGIIIISLSYEILMVVMRCLCSLIMIKSGGRRMADIAMALSPPQVETWRLKQGTEAMDS